MGVAKPRAPRVEGAAFMGRRCRLRGAKAGASKVEALGIVNENAIKLLNLSICQPICQPYNLLSVSVLCPLADRLTDISQL